MSRRGKRKHSRKRSKRSVAHLRRYWFKKKRKGHSMAKRRRKGRKSHHRRRRGHRRSHRRRHSGGGGGGWLPGRDDQALLIAGAAVGYAENKAKADANFVLNKVPRPIVQLGYTGGTALALWAVSKLVGGRIGHYARLGARAAGVAATYQMGKQGGVFTAVTIGDAMGYDTLGHPDDEEHIIGDETMGALDVEARSASAGHGGIPYDDGAEDAGAHT